MTNSPIDGMHTNPSAGPSQLPTNVHPSSDRNESGEQPSSSDWARHRETHRSNNSSDGDHGEQPPPLFPGTSIPRAPTSQTGGMYPGTRNPLGQRGPGLFGPSGSNIPMTGSNAISLSGNIASTSNIATASNVSTASTSNLNRTPDMMPLLGAKSAPAKFTGKYDSVKKFMRQYKQIFIEALDSFVDEDWNQLETDILTYYDAELNESRYLVSDLNDLTDEWRKKGMHNLTQFKEYEVEFLTIANWLLHKGKITKDEQHTKYWYGLNRKLREVIEARYLAAHPGYDPQKVIP
ncbi:hypothetical protein EDD85DRAFT_948368 [Armillaria nabsnona]|nr:hypothetical protein EDD85DRAFT_948368 [Armillaria nabsnona]